MGIYLGVPPDSVIDYSDKLVNGKKLNETVSASYAACETKGATMPALSAQTADNLSGTIGTIQPRSLISLSSLQSLYYDPDNNLNIGEIGQLFNEYYGEFNKISLPVVKRILGGAFGDGEVNWDNVYIPNVEILESGSFGLITGGRLYLEKITNFDLYFANNGIDVYEIDLPNVSSVVNLDQMINPHYGEELSSLKLNSLKDGRINYAFDYGKLQRVELNSITRDCVSRGDIKFSSPALKTLELGSITAEEYEEFVEWENPIEGSQWNNSTGEIRTDLPILIKCKNDVVISADYDKDNNQWVYTH